MNKSFWRLALVAGGALILSACGNKETREALDKASDLAKQKRYADANEVLIVALQARETNIRNAAGNPTDQSVADALVKKVQADSEILKMEREEIQLYLRMDRADMASEVYRDVLLGDPKDTSVYDALKNPDQVIRIGVVHIFGLVADFKPNDLGKTIDALVGATKDSNQDVRRAAVAALGEIKDPRVVPPLIDELKDPYWFARSEAADALGAEHDERAVKPLIDAVADSEKTVSSAAQNALIILSQQPEGIARPDDFGDRLNDPNPRVSMIAAVCLGMMKDSRAVPVLIKLLDSSDQTVRLDAVKGLGESGDRSALPMLRQLLKDPDLNMRGWSIIGLGELKDEDSLMDLEHIAADDAETPDIRAAATAAADKIKSSLPPLETPSP